MSMLRKQSFSRGGRVKEKQQADNGIAGTRPTLFMVAAATAAGDMVRCARTVRVATKRRQAHHKVLSR